MVTHIINLESKQLGYLEKENIDLNDFVRAEIKKLMDESKNK